MPCAKRCSLMSYLVPSASSAQSPQELQESDSRLVLSPHNTIIFTFGSRLFDIPQLSPLPTLPPLPARNMEATMTRAGPCCVSRDWLGFKVVVAGDEAREHSLLLLLLMRLLFRSLGITEYHIFEASLFFNGRWWGPRVFDLVFDGGAGRFDVGSVEGLAGVERFAGVEGLAGGAPFALLGDGGAG